MLEGIILGIVQGVAEWLPISSEGMIIVIKNTFFPSGDFLAELIGYAIFLHLGTFLAALVYFRKEVGNLIRAIFKFKESSEENKKTLLFLIVSTLVSGILGFLILQSIIKFESELKFGSKFISVIIAVMLFVTAYLQIKRKKKTEISNLKREKDLTMKDGLVLGIFQGFSIIPGLSRSGLTASALLLKKFDEEVALKLSFLMSLPIVFFGNLVLGGLNFSSSLVLVLSLVASFVAGLITISLLLRLARKINFGYFALFFGLLILISVFI